VPQLILPQGLDHFVNGDLSARAGTALVLRPDALSPEAVTAAARRLLDEPAFAAAARAVAADIASMPGAAEVLAGLIGEPVSPS
jgi:UDP:flavonoid glycosyltransferase YjiC (YdhE family)